MGLAGPALWSTSLTVPADLVILKALGRRSTRTGTCQKRLPYYGLSNSKQILCTGIRKIVPAISLDCKVGSYDPATLQLSVLSFLLGR